MLHPSIGAQIQATLYGFLVYDTKGTEVDKWRRRAIVDKSDEWSDSALRVVRNLSNEVILLRSDQEERVETVLPGVLTQLTNAA